MENKINTQTSNHHLPADIIEEILFDLPVKSLLRFKCVSKRWRSLISSKEFIKHHLNKSNTNHKFIKLTFDKTNDSLRSYSLRSLLDGNYTDTIKPTLDPHPMGINWAHILRSSTHLCYYDKEPVDYDKVSTDYPMITTFEGVEKWAFYLRVLGSCNGLVLISINRRDLILWNPSTREAKNITPPSSYSFRKKPPYPYHYLYGFGFDESSNDYKVVCIFSLSEPQLTEIYSSRTDSWKKIDNFDKIFMFYQDGKFVNERLHWTTIKEHDGSCWDDIVSLHLVEEKFEILAQPRNFSTNDYRQTIVEDFGGYLSLVSFSLKSDIDVWVMMEYGETKSWTKIWTLSNIDNVHAIPYPFWLRKNGEIAVCFGSEVVVYNGQNKLRKFQLNVFEVVVYCHLYVESLVSPFGDEHLRSQ